VSAPQDLERTDEQPKSQYLSRRDVKVFVIAVVVLAVALSPVYFVLKENSDAFLCKRNLRAISKAISLYAIENNDRLPPAFVTPDGVRAYVEGNGAVYTWANLVDAHMSRDASFKCPKASDEECFIDHDIETGALMPVSYGMYLPMSGMPLSSVPNPESAILITETSSLGYNDTLDPHPYFDINDQKVKDGFVVTWDTGNKFPEGPVSSVTRLAFGDTKDGRFLKDGPTRHPGGNHFLTVAGSSITLKPTAASVEWDSKRRQITGRWAIPETAEFSPSN
jgi:hypothetical protein